MAKSYAGFELCDVLNMPEVWTVRSFPPVAAARAGLSRSAVAANPQVFEYPPDTASSSASAPLGKHPFRILVIEDDYDAARGLEKTLQHWGHEARVCTLGSEGLAMAPYYQPQIVIIDIGLPDMDGWQVARRLLQQSPERRPVLIAVTAHGETEDYHRSQKTGINFHLVKPAFYQQLHEILQRLAADS